MVQAHSASAPRSVIKLGLQDLTDIQHSWNKSDFLGNYVPEIGHHDRRGSFPGSSQTQAQTAQ